MTDEHTIALLQSLREDVPGPSGIDVAQAMIDGRRRRHKWRWPIGAAAIAVVAVAGGGGLVAASSLHVNPHPQPQPGPTGCVLTPLPIGDATWGQVTRGDSSGHYLLGSLMSKSHPAGLPVLWKDGVRQSLPTVPDELRTYTAVNRSGTVLINQEPGYRSYVLRGSRAIALHGTRTSAVAINDHDVIVGIAREDVVRWSSPSAEPEVLPVPAGTHRREPVAIDNDGTVVGELGSDQTTGQTGYLWFPDGTHRAIPLPTLNGRPVTGFLPQTIAGGWVTGDAVVTMPNRESLSTAVRYRIATNTFEVVPDSDDGTALGAANGWTLINGVRGPAIVAGSHVVPLPASNGSSYQVRSLSADGRIAGGVLRKPGTEFAKSWPVQWMCH